MPKDSGKFIVIEGIDGSGKSTQTKILTERLKNEGYEVILVDFPQYGKRSAGLVEEYLTGKYGNAEEVGPYRASIFYACDRYDNSAQIKKWLEEGKIVVADRYIGSNIGHQGGKIIDKRERKRFLKWLYELEYGIFEIPKPDLAFVLRTPPSLSQSLSGKITDKEKRAKKKSFLGRRKRDLHEEDLNHLINTDRSYLEAAKEFPEDFKVIECSNKEKLLPPEIIHQKIWRIFKKIL